jgi:hypothetical protein
MLECDHGWGIHDELWGHCVPSMKFVSLLPDGCMGHSKEVCHERLWYACELVCRATDVVNKGRYKGRYSASSRKSHLVVTGWRFRVESRLL